MIPAKGNNLGDNTRISIKEVNMPKSYVQGTDAFNRSYQITLDFHSALVAIPQVGEMWRIVRRGTDWTLDKRLETGNEKTSIMSLSSGDRRIDAPGTLHLNGTKVLINKIPFGTVFTTETLPEPSSVPPGTIVFVSDAADGSQFQGSNGSAWKILG